MLQKRPCREVQLALLRKATPGGEDGRRGPRGFCSFASGVLGSPPHSPGGPEQGRGPQGVRGRLWCAVGEGHESNVRGVESLAGPYKRSMRERVRPMLEGALRLGQFYPNSSDFRTAHTCPTGDQVSHVGGCTPSYAQTSSFGSLSIGSWALQIELFFCWVVGYEHRATVRMGK